MIKLTDLVKEGFQGDNNNSNDGLSGFRGGDGNNINNIDKLATNIFTYLMGIYGQRGGEHWDKHDDMREINKVAEMIKNNK